MAGNNTVEQVVKVNSKDYVEGIRKAKNAAKEFNSEAGKDLNAHGKAWQTTDNQVKISTGSMQKQLKDLGKSIKENMVNGLLINAGRAASNFVSNGISQSAKAMLSFGEAMSRVQLKTGMTNKGVSELQDQLTQLARTGASLQSIPDAFDEIFSSVGDVEKSKGILSTISQFSKGVEGRDASGVAKFVRGTLTSENQPITSANTSQLLSAVGTMMKSGGFKNLNEAMGAFGGLNGNALADIHMSNRNAAGMLSGASGVANKEQSIAAVNELIKGAGTGFAGNAVLNGIMGGNLIKNGQLDPKELQNASKRFKEKGYSDQGFKELLGKSGMSEDAANGIANILKNADKFSEGIDKFNKSTITAEEAGNMLGNNLSGKLEDIFQGILASFTNLFNHLTGLDFGKALGDVMKHPGEILGSLGALAGSTALTGFAAKSVLGMIGGGGAAAAGGAGAVGAAEVAGGAALPAAGLGAGALALGAAGVGAAGLVGYGVGTVANLGIDKYTQGTNDEGYSGSAIERLIFKLDQLMGGDASANIMKANKIELELHSKDPGYLMKPKASDNSKDPRGP